MRHLAAEEAHPCMTAVTASPPALTVVQLKLWMVRSVAGATWLTKWVSAHLVQQRAQPWYVHVPAMVCALPWYVGPAMVCALPWYVPCHGMWALPWYVHQLTFKLIVLNL